MFYHYECQSCGKVTEIQCRMSERKREIKCPSCAGVSKKMIEAPTLVNMPSNKHLFSEEMTKKNEEAGKRMRSSHKSMKTVKQE